MDGNKTASVGRPGEGKPWGDFQPSLGAPAMLPAGGETESGCTSGCPSKEQVSIPVCPPLQGGEMISNPAIGITSMSLLRLISGRLYNVVCRCLARDSPLCSGARPRASPCLRFLRQGLSLAGVMRWCVWREGSCTLALSHGGRGGAPATFLYRWLLLDEMLWVEWGARHGTRHRAGSCWTEDGIAAFGGRTGRNYLEGAIRPRDEGFHLLSK